MNPDHTPGRPPCGKSRLPSALLLAAMLLLALPGAAQDIRVAVISDLNGSYGSTEYDRAVGAAVARIIALRPDLVISTGDMVAGQRRPHLSRSEIEAMWAAFESQVSAPLAAAGIPLAVTPGNHDASAYAGFATERAIYAERWRQRRPALQFIDAANYPFHYAFALGEVLFVGLDATTVGALPLAQMRWLTALLAEQGVRYARRVVFSHLPLWPVASGRETETIGDPVLQALLSGTAVDIYLSGHHHAFYPGHKDGVVFVSQACLGAGRRRLIGDAARAARSFTLIELAPERLEIAAYAAPGFVAPVDWHDLPRQIRSRTATLQRADLAQVPGLQF